MMRCIQNAVDGGHLSPEEGRLLNERVSDMLREGLAAPEVRARMVEGLAKEAAERHRRSLLQEARRVDLTERVLAHTNARGEHDPAEALIYLLEHQGQARFSDIETRRKLILDEAHKELAGLLHDFRKGWLKGDRRRNNSWVAARLDNVVRELFGQKTGDARAKELAEAWGKVSERLRQRFNTAGGHIEKLERYGLPQVHNKDAVHAATRQVWVDRLMRKGVLDRERMVSQTTGRRMSDDELRQALEEVWEAITTDGWSKREPGYVAFGRGALANQHAEHRFLHFKDADQWLAYQREFGEPDPFGTMMGHLSIMSRDIATMEVLGPNPEVMRNYLKQLVKKQAAMKKPVDAIVREQSAKLKSLVAQATTDPLAERLTARVEAIFGELAELRRKGALRRSASGRSSSQFDNEVWNLHNELQQLQTDLGKLTSGTLADRKAALERQMAGVVGKIDAIQNKALIPGRGVSARNKRAIARLQGELKDLEGQLEKLDGADPAIAVADPQAHAALEAQLAAMRSEVAFAPVGDPMSVANKRIAEHDRMWDTMRGTLHEPERRGFADGMQVARNLMAARLLGGAAVTALTDFLFHWRAFRRIGLHRNTMQVFGGVIEALRTGTREELTEVLGILDSAVHVGKAQARYMDGIDAVSKSGYLADRIISLSGLSALTQAQKHAFSLGYMREMAKAAGKSWEALPERLRWTLQDHDISPAEWNRMRQAPQYDRGRMKLLRAEEMRGLEGGEALAEKYVAMLYRERMRAVPERFVRSGALTTQGRRGSLGGELTRSVSQFKSFGVSVLMLQIGDIVRDMRLGRYGRATEQTASLMLLGAFYGAIVLQMKEILWGRDPIPMTDEDGQPSMAFWGAAVLQSGGLGVLGDLLFSNVNRFGGGLSSTLVGPVGNELDRLRTRAYATYEDFYKGDDPNYGRAALRTVEEFEPFSKLWYFRTLSNRLIWNELQKAVDPNASSVFLKQERYQKKRLGNEFWWRPGETRPGRLPAIDGLDPMPPAAAPGPAASSERARQVLLDTMKEMFGDQVADAATPEQALANVRRFSRSAGGLGQAAER